MSSNILITGGAGFIGSHVVRFFVKTYPNYNIINLDKLLNSSNICYLDDIINKKNYTFIKADICDSSLLKKIFNKYKIDKVINLAAESHVDASIEDPVIFAKTNVLGTLNLLIAAKNAWGNNYSNKLFYHISTDEVYGELGLNGFFNENSRYKPSSPYSASKASSDHFVRSFSHTYELPTLISNCSNNYGPNQHPEKLIPLFIKNILENKPLPIYGNGKNIRDWLYVSDHVRAIDVIFHNGKIGETYNIGGDNEINNIDLTNMLIKITDTMLGRSAGFSEKLITFVDDRKGHDFRYAINSNKIKENLGWKPKMDFTKGLELTIDWYINNKYPS